MIPPSASQLPMGCSGPAKSNGAEKAKFDTERMGFDVRRGGATTRRSLIVGRVEG